jgi:hypothetical protein
MSVLCSHCGEELMGAVNRCWKCGKLIGSHSGPLDVPPIRRSPIVGPLNAPLEATVLEEPVEAGVTPEMRRGSPFVKNAAVVRVAGPTQSPPTPSPLRPISPPASSSTSSQLVSAVAVCLSLVAWGVSFAVPIATLCLALFAIALGIWGLFGSKRGLAIFSLIFGCTALAWGSFQSLVQIYKMVYGVHPFA